MKVYKALLVVGVITLGFALAIFSRGESTPTATPTSVPTAAPTKEVVVYPTETIDVHDPSFDEMISFLNSNKVNWQVYRENYDCFDFACDLQREAFEHGIRSAFVAIYYSVGGHAIVAFETTDKGLIYIEPQADLPVKVEVGTKYADDIITGIRLEWDLSYCDLDVLLFCTAGGVGQHPACDE